MPAYDLVLVLVGLAVLASALLPRLLARRPISFPLACVAIGAGAGLLPLGVDPDPLRNPAWAERLTELGVIIALMGSGLQLDRPPGLRAWASTWRLLAVTMPLTIAATAILGWAALGLAPAAALLLGAVLAPTDPVLASDVQVGPPGERREPEVRFALTSEAGLNDGLAFPFTNAAIAMAIAGGVAGPWLARWALVDVLYRVAAALAIGVAIGLVLAALVFRLPRQGALAETREGFVVIAMTLLAYGATELAHAYGFIAVFVAAVMFRQRERRHSYHKILHHSSDQAERALTAFLLVLFGAALVQGLLAPLTLPMALVGLAVLLLIRPLAGLAGLLGMARPWPERAAIAFFGIRGIGSFYYLAYALNRVDRPEADALWALVAFVVLASILLHGLTARPAMALLERRRPAKA